MNMRLFLPYIISQTLITKGLLFYIVAQRPGLVESPSFAAAVSTLESAVQ